MRKEYKKNIEVRRLIKVKKARTESEKRSNKKADQEREFKKRRRRKT